MNYTLAPLLDSFSKKEWKLLGKHIEMHHSQASQIYRLYGHLEANREKLKGHEIVEEIRKSNFEEVSLPGYTKLLSKLFKLTEEWLVSDEIQKIDLRKEVFLNKIYNNRGLFNLADRKAKKILGTLDGKSAVSLQDQKYRSELIHQQFYSDNPIKYERNSNLFAEVINNYNLGQKQEALLYLCEATNWGSITQSDYTAQITILEQIISILPDSKVSLILDELSRLLKTLDLDIFLRLRTRVFSNELSVPSELHTVVTIYLINSCIKLWRKGEYLDAEQNAILIEYGLSSGVLTSSGRIPVKRFYNLITTLGKLKTYQWNIDFIDRWIDKVETRSITSARAFAAALNAFNFQKYELIEELLRDVEFEHFEAKMRALGLEMIALYVDRKNNYYVLRNFISNYKRTLKRSKKKTSSVNLKSYLNLVKVIELLVQKDFRRLTIKLEKYDYLAYRTWITEEVNKRQSTAHG